MSAQQATRAVQSSPPRRLDLPVLDRRDAGRDFVWLTLGAPCDWKSLPGQFVNVLCESDARGLKAGEGRILDDTAAWPRTTGLELSERRALARRPFSVSRIQRDGGRVRLVLLVQRKGRGSRFLQTRPVAGKVDVLGPLGNHFAPPKEDRLSVLVSGGCGLAPIFGLADYLAAAGRRVVHFFGASTVEAMPLTFDSPPRPTGDRVEETSGVAEFADLGGQAILATDDGSAGFHGPVTQALRHYLAEVRPGRPLALYGCGPSPMLRSLADVATDHDLPCQISLERYMGCGTGMCLSCVARRRDPTSQEGWTYFLTCREGPVVDAHQMIWDDA